MKFSQIIEHLSKRGFATRELWGGNAYLVFGIDNIAWMVQKDFTETHSNGYGQSVTVVEYPSRKNAWTPCLAEMYAEDWQILDMYWDTPRDDYKPFES